MSVTDVLVVDDDVAVCRIVPRMLSDEQYAVQAAHSVADALEALEQKFFDVYVLAENRKPDKPAGRMIIGIDGAFVKGRRPTDRASLEIITGRFEADAEPSKVFAVVWDQDGRSKQHVQALTRQRGRGPETKVRVVLDGVP
jgi:hypothetical protein